MAYPIAHPKVMERAGEVLRLNPVFLDTETTGIGLSDVVIEVAVVDSNGEMLFNGLINPERPIPEESSKVHGITNEMVKDALTMRQIWRDRAVLKTVPSGSTMPNLICAFEAIGLVGRFRGSQRIRLLYDETVRGLVGEGIKGIAFSNRKSWSSPDNFVISTCQTVIRH